MKLHSFVGIITNSSTELFTVIGRHNIKSLTKLGELLGGKIEVRPIDNPEEAYKDGYESYLKDVSYGESDNWYVKEAKELFEYKDWEGLWNLLTYSYSVPYPYSVYWIKDGKETDITSLLLDCVEAVECGNGN